MKTRTVFRGIAPFKTYTVLSWERVSENEEHVLLEGDGGGRVNAKVINGMRGGSLQVGERSLLAVTREPVRGRAEIINRHHPHPRIGRVSLGILAYCAKEPVEMLASHLEWARYGPVGSADILFKKRSGRMEIYAQDGNLLIDAKLDAFSVKGDVVTLSSEDHRVPETVAVASEGRALQEILDHPALNGLGIVIDSMTAGGPGEPITITTRDDGIPVTRAIALATQRST